MISNQIAPIKSRLLLIATLAPNSMLCTCSATVRLSIHNTPLRTIPRTAVLKTFVGGAGLGFAAGRARGRLEHQGGNAGVCGQRGGVGGGDAVDTGSVAESRSAV